jgi:hypothetical protein
MPSRAVWGLLSLGLAACASSNEPGARTAPSEMEPRAEPDRFIDDDGTVKDRVPGSAAPSEIGLPNDIVRIRCHVSTEGAVFGCTQLSGPSVVEERLVTALKRTRVKPILEDGKPVEGLRTFVVRIKFLMR